MIRALLLAAGTGTLVAGISIVAYAGAITYQAGNDSNHLSAGGAMTQPNTLDRNLPSSTRSLNNNAKAADLSTAISHSNNGSSSKSGSGSGSGTGSASKKGPPHATPEPATLILLGTGITGIAANIRKRRKNSQE